jgi:transcriptional regulator with XRE-family HTH domain
MEEPPNTPQAIWGRELKHYRNRAGLTQAELAARLYCSDSLISSIETGQAPAMPDFAEAADRELSTDGVLVRTLDYRKNEPAYPTWFIDWLPAEQTDTAFGGAVSTRTEDIATATASWESISSAALPEDMSRDLILKSAEELWNHHS